MINGNNGGAQRGADLRLRGNFFRKDLAKVDAHSGKDMARGLFRADEANQSLRMEDRELEGSAQNGRPLNYSSRQKQQIRGRIERNIAATLGIDGLQTGREQQLQQQIAHLSQQHSAPLEWNSAAEANDLDGLDRELSALWPETARIRQSAAFNVAPLIFDSQFSETQQALALLQNSAVACQMMELLIFGRITPLNNCGNHQVGSAAAATKVTQATLYFIRQFPPAIRVQIRAAMSHRDAWLRSGKKVALTATAESFINNYILPLHTVHEPAIGGEAQLSSQFEAYLIARTYHPARLGDLFRQRNNLFSRLTSPYTPAQNNSLRQLAELHNRRQILSNGLELTNLTQQAEQLQTEYAKRSQELAASSLRLADLDHKLEQVEVQLVALSDKSALAGVVAGEASDPQLTDLLTHLGIEQIANEINKLWQQSPAAKSASEAAQELRLLAQGLQTQRGILFKQHQVLNQSQDELDLQIAKLNKSVNQPPSREISNGIFAQLAAKFQALTNPELRGSPAGNLVDPARALAESINRDFAANVLAATNLEDLAQADERHVETSEISVTPSVGQRKPHFVLQFSAREREVRFAGVASNPSISQLVLELQALATVLRTNEMEFTTQVELGAKLYTAGQASYQQLLAGQEKFAEQLRGFIFNYSQSSAHARSEQNLVYLNAALERAGISHEFSEFVLVVAQKLSIFSSSRETYASRLEQVLEPLAPEQRELLRGISNFIQSELVPQEMIANQNERIKVNTSCILNDIILFTPVAAGQHPLAERVALRQQSLAKLERLFKSWQAESLAFIQPPASLTTTITAPSVGERKFTALRNGLSLRHSELLSQQEQLRTKLFVAQSNANSTDILLALDGKERNHFQQSHAALNQQLGDFAKLVIQYQQDYAKFVQLNSDYLGFEQLATEVKQREERNKAELKHLQTELGRLAMTGLDDGQRAPFTKELTILTALQASFNYSLGAIDGLECQGFADEKFDRVLASSHQQARAQASELLALSISLKALIAKIEQAQQQHFNSLQLKYTQLAQELHIQQELIQTTIAKRAQLEDIFARKGLATVVINDLCAKFNLEINKPRILPEHTVNNYPFDIDYIAGQLDLLSHTTRDQIIAALVIFNQFIHLRDVLASSYAATLTQAKLTLSNLEQLSQPGPRSVPAELKSYADTLVDLKGNMREFENWLILAENLASLSDIQQAARERLNLRQQQPYYFESCKLSSDANLEANGEPVVELYPAANFANNGEYSLQIAESASYDIQQYLSLNENLQRREEAISNEDFYNQMNLLKASLFNPILFESVNRLAPAEGFNLLERLNAAAISAGQLPSVSKASSSNASHQNSALSNDRILDSYLTKRLLTLNLMVEFSQAAGGSVLGGVNAATSFLKLLAFSLRMKGDKSGAALVADLISSYSHLSQGFTLRSKLASEPGQIAGLSELRSRILKLIANLGLQKSEAAFNKFFAQLLPETLMSYHEESAQIKASIAHNPRVSGRSAEFNAFQLRCNFEQRHARTYESLMNKPALTPVEIENYMDMFMKSISNFVVKGSVTKKGFFLLDSQKDLRDGGVFQRTVKLFLAYASDFLLHCKESSAILPQEYLVLCNLTKFCSVLQGMVKPSKKVFLMLNQEASIMAESQEIFFNEDEFKHLNTLVSELTTTQRIFDDTVDVPTAVYDYGQFSQAKHRQLDELLSQSSYAEIMGFLSSELVHELWVDPKLSAQPKNGAEHANLTQLAITKLAILLHLFLQKYPLPVGSDTLSNIRAQLVLNPALRHLMKFSNNQVTSAPCLTIPQKLSCLNSYAKTKEGEACLFSFAALHANPRIPAGLLCNSNARKLDDLAGYLQFELFEKGIQAAANGGEYLEHRREYATGDEADMELQQAWEEHLILHLTDYVQISRRLTQRQGRINLV